MVAPKAKKKDEMTQEEMDQIRADKDRIYGKAHLVRTDDALANHIESYTKTQDSAKNIFNSYQRTFLDLNKELRTDRERIIHLQDNVPVNYTLHSTDDCAYFAFPTNFDLNPKGTMMIVFEATKPVVLFISDETRKPQRNNAQKTLYASDRFHPTTRRARMLNDGGDPLYIQNVQTYCYLTVQALDAPAHGKIHIKTEINVLHLTKLYNEGGLKSSEALKHLGQSI